MHWIILSLLSAVFASLVAIFGKIGISKIDSTLATSLRAIIMAIFIVILAFGQNKFKLLDTLDNKAIIFIVLSGIAGALSWLMYFLALKSGPATGVAALDRLSVVFVVVFAALFLSESLTWKTASGALLITSGALLMVLN
ncbi:MAG TPA: EamA family transporter [Candidatus Wirthbacteria bacterium]|nr:EamA family transporter [Candidatus Wirthbacteria bacterium]